jgi:hypothetical protein
MLPAVEKITKENTLKQLREKYEEIFKTKPKGGKETIATAIFRYEQGIKRAQSLKP